MKKKKEVSTKRDLVEMTAEKSFLEREAVNQGSIPAPSLLRSESLNLSMLQVGVFFLIKSS